MVSAGILVYFGLSFLATMALGLVQQRRAQEEEEEERALPHNARSTPAGASEKEDEEGCSLPPKSYGLLAVALIAVQAAVSVATLGGSGAFPPAAALVAVTLLCHHTLIHWRSRFEGEACSCAPFQCKDVSNHETWVVAALVAAAVSWWGV